jgi:hypothetical protein
VTKGEAVALVANYAASLLESGGLDVGRDDLPGPDVERVEWATDEVARRLRAMGSR